MADETAQTKKTTCYLLVGGADGALDISLRASQGRIAELEIASNTGFGGWIWKVVAQMLIDTPLETEALNEQIARMGRAGLVPEELNLQPLVQALVRLGQAGGSGAESASSRR